MKKGRESGQSDTPIDRDPLGKGLRCHRGQQHIHTALFVFPLFPQTKRKLKAAGKLTELLASTHFMQYSWTKEGWGALASLGGGRESDHSSQMNTNKMENLAHWRYFFACKQIRVNYSNHFCMSSFSNLYKAFPLQYAGPFNSQRHVGGSISPPWLKQQRQLGPPDAPARLCLLNVTDVLRSGTLANAKLIDILESQLAIFMIQQL